MDASATIKQQLAENPIVLYMKGSPQFPQCGFSALAVEILAKCKVERGRFLAVNVLLEPEIRQAVKEHADWPTIPQLYVSGEFVGGSDILRSMYESGELQPLLAAATGSSPG